MTFSFDFLNSFLGGGILGVDIGTASIKIVELSKKGDIYHVDNYGILSNFGHFDRSNDVIQTSTMRIFDKDAVRLLRLLLDNMGIKKGRVVASLPTFSAFIALIELPDISDQEVAQTIKFQAKQYVPLPLEEVTLDYIPVGRRIGNDGKAVRQILLVSVPTEKIKSFKGIFKEAGLDLIALEVEGLSAVRSLIQNDQTTTLILDIGSHSTSILIAQGGFLKASSQADYASNHLTHALSKGLNINLSRAEDLKKQKGLLGTGGEFELSTIMFPFVDVIIKEAIRAKERFEKTYGGRVERVILSGAGSNLPGLVKYVEKQINTPTLLANPLLGFSYNKQIESAVLELGPTLTVALGLALRGF